MNEKSPHSFLNDNFKKIFFEKNFLKKNSELLLADLNKKQEEIVIQSDKQYEKNTYTFTYFFCAFNV